MKPVFFSIIIPCYNVEQYLPACLNSLIAQTFTDWEAICIDDGSTDGTGEILNVIAQNDARIKIYRQNNGGVSCARNKGVELATGEWVTFLDADDMYASEWLNTAHELIVASAPDVLRMRATILSEEVRPIDKNNRFLIINTNDALMDWGWRSFTKEGWQWLLFQKRNHAVKYKFPVDVRYSEDSLRALSILRDLKRVCQGEYAGYYYRNRPGSACGQLFSADERIRFFKQCIKILPGRKEKPLYANFIWSNIVVWAIKHKTDGQEKHLHTVFRTLVGHAKVTVTDIKAHWRIPYYLYVTSGLISPILIVNWLLRAVTCVRYRCRCLD